MDNFKTIIRSKVDLSLPFFSMYEKFLLQWEEDKELEESLKEIKVEEIEEELMEIFKDYYSQDKLQKLKEIKFKEFSTYTKHNLVHALNTKSEHLIFNTTVGVIMSKTSLEKFLKHYSLDDITRVRLYCMFHKHSKVDDDFIRNLDKLNIKWKPMEIKNPKRIIYRFPKISV